MKTKLNFLMVLALLLGLVFSSAPQTVLAASATVDGLLFDDLDRDGFRDLNEGAPVEGTMIVALDQDCDGAFEDSRHINYYTGQFSFETATLGLSYCLVIPRVGNWRTTTTLEPFVAEKNNHFEIGVYDTQLIFSPTTLPNGSVGEAYLQTITIDGGEPPYSCYECYYSLPAGMTFDEATLTLSGTPTAAGGGVLYLHVEDVDGMWGWEVLEFYIQTDGLFTLVSSSNPSIPGQEVTFTLTGSGHPEWDIHSLSGRVKFYDGDTAIEGCGFGLLNWDLDLGYVDRPAVCTTSALAEGPHEIRAVFTSFHEEYRDAILTLTQVVGQIDNTPPVVEVMGVSEGSTYILGAVPAAGCSTTDAESGVATEATLSLSGGNALGVGSFTATCSGASDNAGNQADPVSVHYNVTFLFTGFTSPVDNNGVLNIAKAGQTIPLKFRITDANGNPVTNLTSVTVTAVSLSCSAGTTTDLIEEYASGASGLQNLGDGYYQWNWKIPTSYANSCKTLKLDLGEGAGFEHTALFQFRK